MIAIGTPNAALAKEKFDNKTIDGITFNYSDKKGLFIIFKHNGSDDASAKKVAKNYLASIEEFAGMFVTVKTVDETGRMD